MMSVISSGDGYSKAPVSVKTRSGSFTYGFKSPELPVGTMLNVMVTHVTNPEHFHCQATKYAASFGHLADKIHIHYSKLQPEEETLKLVSPGQPCVAQYSVDKSWYRAKVNRELTNGVVEVFFVDYGNIELVPKHLIKVTKPEFMEMPAQGIQCSLNRINNVRGYWSPENIAKFEDLVLEQFFTANIKSVGGGGVHSVELSKEGENIHVNLIYGHLTNTLCLEVDEDDDDEEDDEEECDPSSRSVTVGRDRSNLQVTVASESRNSGNKRISPKGRSPVKNTKGKWSPMQDMDNQSDNGFPLLSTDLTFSDIGYRNYKFNVGEHLDICMIFLISPQEFWCQPLCMGSKLKNLMKELNEKNSGATYTDFKGIPPSKTPCLAKFTDDGIWYRAEVVEVKQDKAAVFYVDYGNAEILSLSHLRVLPSRFAEVPTLAVKCSLNLPTGSAWSESQINLLQDLALDHRVTGKVLSYMHDCYLLDLFDPITKKNLVSIVENKNVLEPLNLTNGSTLPVTISWICSPDVFWLQPVSNEEQLQELVQEMQDYYNMSSETYTGHISVGTHVVAQFSEDSAWYRALVEEVHNTKVLVRFVDFGNDELVSLASLKPLIPPFIKYSCQAVCCHLLDVKPPSPNEWGTDAKVFLEGINDDIICTFKKLVKNVFHVELKVNGVSLAERLVELGLAAIADVKPQQLTETNGQINSKHTINSFKVIQPRLDKLMAVMISYCCSVSDFWCQMVSFSEELNVLMDELAADCESLALSHVVPSELSVGSPCIAKYSEDDAWYRALVVNIQGYSFTVLFVDYGNTEKVTVGNMRQMTSKFLHLPRLAVHCKLPGLHSFPPDTNDLFSELVLEKSMQAKFLNFDQSDGVYEVDLIESPGTSVAKNLKNASPKPVANTAIAVELPKAMNKEQQVLPVIEWNEKLPQGYSKTASISYVYTPDCFYVQFEEDGTKIENLIEFLNREYSKTIWQDKYLTSVEIGMHCSAKYYMDNQWYRAVIYECNDNSASVRFVDYGNSETVTFKDIKPLTENFQTIPYLAYKCSLGEVVPTENKWSKKACDLFEDLIYNKTLSLKNIGNGKCILTNEIGNVGSLLIKSGNAQKSGSNSESSSLPMEPSSAEAQQKTYLDVIFEKDSVEELNESMPGILFISNDIFVNTAVPSEKVECHVTCISESKQPGIFYLRLANVEEQYSELYELLCHNLINYNNPLLKENSLCCVYNPEIKGLCRGVITTVKNDSLVNVKAIDSGKYLKDVPVSSLVSIPEDARALPALAMPCILKHCPNWNERQRSRFHLLTHGRCLTVGFNSTSKPYHVELFTEDGTVISEAICRRTPNKELCESSSKDESVLQPLDVLQYESLGVYLAHIVTPEDFWCQPEESVSSLKKLEEEMSAHCTKGIGHEETTGVAELKPGSLCVIRATKDDKFYRGKVQSMKRFSCDILMVDYGYTETVEKKSIWPMNEEFLELPAQAFECHLANIQSKNGSWSKTSIEAFRSLCFGQLMTAQVISILQHSEGTGYIIDLTLNNKNLANLLVEEQIADSYTKVELSNNVIVNRSTVDAVTQILGQCGQKSLLTGDSLRVQVCNVKSPQKFSVQILTKVPLIEQIENLLTEIYGYLAEPEEPAISNLKVGMLCAVIDSCSSGGSSYRAILETVADSACQVCDIDRGVTKEVSPDIVKELLPCFLDVPPQAFHCVLSEEEEPDSTLHVGWIGRINVKNLNENGHYIVSLQTDDGSIAAPKYLEPTFEPSFTIEAKVCFTSNPHDFWCQFSNSPGLDSVMSQLGGFHCDKPIPPSAVRDGLPCIARYSEDGVFYRAEVISVDLSSANVIFCDYGNVELVELAELMPVPEELLILPKQAFHCCLNDVMPKGDVHWDEDMCTGFEEIVTEKTFVVSFQSKQNEDNIYVVSMEDKNDKLLQEILIECGIASALTVPIIDITDADVVVPKRAPVENLTNDQMLDNQSIDAGDSSSEEYQDTIEDQGVQDFTNEGSTKTKSFSKEQASEYNDSLFYSDDNTELGVIDELDDAPINSSDNFLDGVDDQMVKKSSSEQISVEDFPTDNHIDYNSNIAESSSSVHSSRSLDEDKTVPSSTNTNSEPSSLTDVEDNQLTTLSTAPSLDMLDPNHNEWEEMDQELTTDLVSNYLAKTRRGVHVDSKIENIFNRLEGCQSFDLDSAFGDTDNDSLSPFLECPLEVQQRVKVILLHCHGPDHFYVRLSSMTEECIQLVNAIQNCVSMLESLLEKDSLPGSPCLAKCVGEEEWQRGIIQGDCNDTLKVFFLDTGKEDIIEKPFVKKCPLSLYKRPAMAIRCFLADILPLHGVWSAIVSDLFKEFTRSQSLEVMADAKSATMYGVYLYRETDDDDDDETLNDRLVDLGYATAEPGFKVGANRELKYSLFHPRSTEHMELSFHDISCCRESCYEDDSDSDTKEDKFCHFSEDSMKGSIAASGLSFPGLSVLEETTKVVTIDVSELGSDVVTEEEIAAKPEREPTFDTEANSTVVCDTEANSIVVCDTEANSIVVCDTEADSTVECDTDGNSIIVCDMANSTVEYDTEANNTKERNIEANSTVECDADSTVDCGTEASGSIECDTEANDTIECDTEANDTIECDTEANDTIECDTVNGTVDYDTEANTTNECNIEANSTVECDADSTVECDTEANGTVDHDTGENTTKECNIEANSTIECDADSTVECDADSTVECDTEANDTIYYDTVANTTKECNTEANSTVECDADSTEVWDAEANTTKECDTAEYTSEECDTEQYASEECDTAQYASEEWNTAAYASEEWNTAAYFSEECDTAANASDGCDTEANVSEGCNTEANSTLEYGLDVNSAVECETEANSVVKCDTAQYTSEEWNTAAYASEEWNTAAYFSEECDTAANASDGCDTEANVSEGCETEANVSEGCDTEANVSEGCDTEANVSEGCDTGANSAVECDTESNSAVECDKESNSAVECDTEANSAVECDTVANSAVECDTVANSAVECDTEANSAVECDTEANSAVECDTEANSAVECDTEANSAVECDTEANSAVECDTEANSAVECDTESNSAVECDTESNSTVECDTEANSAVGCDTEENSAVGCDIETNSAVGCDIETNSAVGCDIETNSAVGCDIEANSGVECDTEANSAVECDTEANRAVECDTEANRAEECDTEANSGVGCATEANSAVVCATESNSAVECDTEANSAVECDTEANSAVECDTEANSAVECDTEANSAVECDTEANSAVGCDTEANSAVGCDTEANSAVGCDTEANSAVGCDTEANSAVGCDTEANSAVECDTEENSAVGCDIETNSAVGCDIETNSAVGCDIEANSGVECDTEANSAVECDTEANRAVECDTEANRAVECDTEANSAVGCDTEANSGVGCATEANSAVECATEANSAVECDTEANSAVECDTEANSAVECDTEANSAVECGTEANSAVECGTEANSAVECGTEANSAVDCHTEANRAVECNTEANSTVECNTEANSTVECNTEANSAVECHTEANSTVECNTEANSTVECNMKANSTVECDTYAKDTIECETKAYSTEECDADAKDTEVCDTEGKGTVESDTEASGTKVSDTERETNAGTVTAEV